MTTLWLVHQVQTCNIDKKKTKITFLQTKYSPSQNCHKLKMSMYDKLNITKVVPKYMYSMAAQLQVTLLVITVSLRLSFYFFLSFFPEGSWLLFFSVVFCFVYLCNFFCWSAVQFLGLFFIQFVSFVVNCVERSNVWYIREHTRRLCL